MTDLNTRAVAQIKLRELQRQRQILRKQYGDLDQAAAGAGDSREKLRLLYRGLQQTRFAQKPLHPEVANLEAILLEADLGTASPEVLEECLRRLRQELAQGQLRAEFAAIFGHLLEEWLAGMEDPKTKSAAGPHPFDQTLELFWSAPEQRPDLSLLQELFDEYRGTFDQVRSAVRNWADQEAQAGVSTSLVQGILKVLGNDITRAPELRRQALDAANNALLVNELAGALTVLIHNFDDWDWPAEGFVLRPLWSRIKWRPYLDEDLLTLLFQSLVGLRWGVLLRQTFANQFNQVGGYYLPGLKLPFRDDAASPEYNQVDAYRAGQYAKLFLPMIPASLQNLQARDSYGGGYESRSPTPDATDTFQELLLLVNAEIRLLQASSPRGPCYVVQTDLRDYYLRIPHDVILFLVENLGFPPRWLNFFRKFLAARVRHAGRQKVVRRGLLLDHILSDVLAEYVLLLLDLHVFRRSKVRLLRVVDDIFFVSADREKVGQAWQAIGQFCRATGLETNPAKSGSLCLSAGPIAELPQGPPRWGMLRLTPEAHWELDPENWRNFQALLRRQLERPMPALNLIALYNSSLNYVLKFMGTLAPLGPAQRRQIAEAVAQMHHGLFGQGHGLMEEVRRRWETSEAGAAQQRIPEALFYWPLTAGGLGLFNPMAVLAGYHDAALAWTAPVVPFENHLVSFGNRWGNYFLQWLQPIKSRTPTATPGLEALLDDFASRSGEVSGRTDKKGTKDSKEKKRRTNLSLYWQWVVYTYGPQLLATLGTFRFLITELVPLQLIVQNRIGASSLSDDWEPAAAETGAEPR